jgi:hypothetical protein
MSYRGYKVVCFTPSGRKRVQSILLDNLSRFTDIIDSYQIWMNTGDNQEEDKKWLESLPDTYGDWIELHYLELNQYKIKPIQMRTGLFYAHNTVDEDTIYIRFDDDIVFIADDFFVNILDFRIDYPDYFLVMANIINNSVTSYIQQMVLKTIPDTYGPLENFCMDPVSWGSGPFAAMIHNTLIKSIELNDVDKFYFDHADLNDATRFSISCFCFFGKDFDEFGGIIGQRRAGVIRFDEEIYLTEVYPVLNDKLNTICGNAVVAHYSFMRQRPYLDKTDILDTYRAIGKGRLSDSYYDLLEGDHDDKNASRTIPYQIVQLPQVKQISTYGSALSAERAGYKSVEQSDRVEIMYKDRVVKTILGKNLSDSDIDRGLAAAWNMRKLP